MSKPTTGSTIIDATLEKFLFILYKQVGEIEEENEAAINAAEDMLIAAIRAVIEEKDSQIRKLETNS